MVKNAVYEVSAPEKTYCLPNKNDAMSGQNATRMPAIRNAQTEKYLYNICMSMISFADCFCVISWMVSGKMSERTGHIAIR